MLADGVLNSGTTEYISLEFEYRIYIVGILLPNIYRWNFNTEYRSNFNIEYRSNFSTAYRSNFNTEYRISEVLFYEVPGTKYLFSDPGTQSEETINELPKNKKSLFRTENGVNYLFSGFGEIKSFEF